MSLAYPIQKFQDWFTQQAVIIWGQRIDPNIVPWLMGPFGKLGAIGADVAEQLAEKENLIIERNSPSQGLISFKELNLSDSESARVCEKIVHFYENTARYKLAVSVTWNPFFKIFGNLVMRLFSNRIKQLNIPTNTIGSNQIKSEIISLKDPKSGEVKHTIWYRTFISTAQVLYSGVYTTCNLPSGKTCVKAVFPLPNGNATVIMSPSVGPNGELRLDSSGKKFGDPGFYFLLSDSKGGLWSQYVSSFRDHLDVRCDEEKIIARQTLTLWRQTVLSFSYEIRI